MIRPLSVLLACLWLVGCGYSRTLTGVEVEQLISEASVSGYHHKDRYHFTRQYDPDGTFVQVRSGRDEEETGRWSLKSSQLCVVWDDSARAFCRTVHTDDRGEYWKILRKKNGSKVRIVTYGEIVDRDGGADRRRVLPPLRWLAVASTSPAGFFTLLGIGLVLVSLGRLLLRGADEPRSLRNRIRRRFPLTVGDSRLRLGQLAGLSPGALQAWIGQAAAEGRWVYVAWAWEVLQDTHGSEAWSLCWDALDDLEDEALVSGFVVVVQVAPPNRLLAPQVGEDSRAVYVLGEAWRQRALSLQRSDRTRFDEARSEALAWLQPLNESREEGEAPDGAGGLAYLGLAAAAVETLLYLKFIEPARTSSSSSGGG